MQVMGPVTTVFSDLCEKYYTHIVKFYEIGRTTF